MKMNNIFKTLLAVSSLALVACQAWYDDHNFEGYKEGSAITNVINTEYALTDDDYTTVANNSTNKAIAEEEGVSDLLAGLKTWKTFGETISAEKYLPAFLASTWPYVDDTSAVSVTYRNAGEIPDEIAAIVTAPLFTLAKEDYQTIWGSDEDYIESLTPNTVSKITKVLPSDGLEAGDYTIVTYNYAESEPSFSTSPAPGPTFTYSSVLGTAAVGDNVSVTACVTGICSQGVIITDLTGSVLLYKGTDYALGDVLTVEGAIASYNKGMQIAALSSTIEKIATDTPCYEMPTIVNANIFDNLLSRASDEYARFVKIPATVTVSGTYYNFTVEGATKATGSFYGITDEIKGKVSDGQSVVLYGYVSSISKQSGNPKFVNLVCTSVDTAPDFNNGLTSVIGGLTAGTAVEAVACVTAISAQGPVISDNSGSILLYKGTDVALGDVLSVSATATSYNKGMQIAASSATIEKLTPMTFSYPYPTILDGAAMDTLLTTTDDFTARYVEVEATVTISGNYYNFSVEGATTATGSFYGITDEMKAKVADGQKYVLRGYVSSISKQSGNPKFVNIIATDAIAASTTNAPAPMAAVVTPKSSIRYAIFQWNGSKFVSTDFAVLQPTDYAEMGQTKNNLEDPETYLPKYMNSKYPYGQAGDSKIVAFILYDGTSSNWMAMQFLSDGNVWTLNDGTVMKTDMFRKTDGVWKVDHTLILDYSEMGTAECKAFYQYCCNWVYDFVDAARYSAPARDNAGVIISTAAVTVGGASPTMSTFVSSYGNNEWYAGTYSYYGEMNWSGSKAASAWAAAGYTLTEAEIVARMQENCQEVFAGVLHYMYPEVTSDDYAKVVINVYDFVSKAVYSYSFSVVGKGEFKYIADSFVKL